MLWILNIFTKMDSSSSTWKLNFIFLAMCFFCRLKFSHAALEPGIYEYKLTSKRDNNYTIITKSLFNNTDVILKAGCSESKSTCNIYLEWVLGYSECDNAFEENNTVTDLISPEKSLPNMGNKFSFQKSTKKLNETCDNKAFFKDQAEIAPITFCSIVNTTTEPNCRELDRQPVSDTGETSNEGKPGKPSKETRHRRGGETTKATIKNHNRIAKTWVDGRYILAFSISSDCGDTEIEVTVKFQNSHGYLSANQRPLLDFYAVMCAAYTILAFLWLLMMACQWRDILRIQFWICGVVLLGLLEKVVFYSEYHHVNSTGYASPATLVFAELVSCLKRTVARMLVIIVSMGFGITKPRLGPQLHRVIGVGFLFFLLSAIEACLRVQGSVQQQLVASIPLAVLDAVICYWIFTNLVDTTRTLRLRRNVVKLWLYRHFTNALIFCIIAAVIFIAWSTKQHKLALCVSKWNEIWLDDAYWHILFYIVLVVIIILWRPTANNQRYAYSALTDAVEDEESKEPMIPESFEGMKMRNVNRPDNSVSTKVEDDLKWVEDNIPASVADTALAVFDDSDEEIVTNIERSKLE
ncbi:transmembrane protein 87A-like isoform X3 [Anneissia japonica]|uniref:transmembrane protein 87A-like isoform X3 n=1 Tax=Anneissia japonica TaxID=1529436 RepID=UPI0014257A15|nr:transmembrane protein 87A-like isoform X3 [Anneissia japonica]